MGEVVLLNLITRLGLQPERVIEGAVDNKVKSVVVIGWDENDEFYFASSITDGGDVLWLMELARKRLLK